MLPAEDVSHPMLPVLLAARFMRADDPLMQAELRAGSICRVFDGLRHALNCRRAREARAYGNLSWAHVRRGGSTPHHTTPQGGVPRQALRASKSRDLTV